MDTEARLWLATQGIIPIESLSDESSQHFARRWQENPNTRPAVRRLDVLTDAAHREKYPEAYLPFTI